MAKGRKPKGPKLVQKLAGSDKQKDQLEVILETITGQLSVKEACEKLGLKEARFHVLRGEVLQAALDRLQPRPAGRPKAPEPTATEKKITELEDELDRLQVQLKLAEVREELALLMPDVYRRRREKEEQAEGGEKKRRKRRSWQYYKRRREQEQAGEASGGEDG